MPPHPLFRVKSRIPSIPITQVSIGTPYQYNQNIGTSPVDSGDTWVSTWADNGNTYFWGNDGNQWGPAGHPDSNMFLNTINDQGITYPTIASASASLVNAMTAWGTAAQVGSDGWTFKTGGLVCVNGVMYATCSRYINTVGTPTRHTMQIIKSTDHGATWTPAPPSTANPYASPMWSTDETAYSTFINYGKNNAFDYGAFGKVPKDSLGDQYVYMPFSNDFASGTFGSCFGNVYLGRCLISAIGNQNPADWSYYVSGDGFNPANWTTTIGSRGNILSGATTSMNLFFPIITFIPFCRRYLLSGGGGNVLEFWEAPHPWGPWTRLPQYNPQIPATIPSGNLVFAHLFSKSLQVDGGRHVVLSTSGLGGSDLYTLWLYPTIISTAPIPWTTFDPNFLAGSPPPALSNNNDTWSSNNSTHNTGGRSATSHSSGRYYLEYFMNQVTAGGGGNYALGIGVAGTSDTGTAQLDGVHNAGNYIPGDGNFYPAGSGGVTGGLSGIANNDVISMAVDIGNNKIWFRKNGGAWSGSGNPATNTGGFSIGSLSLPYFFIANSGVNGDAITTVNTGRYPYVYAPPSGFVNW